MARPNLSYLKNLILALLGVPCGALTGLTGIGNSIVLMPLLRWLIALKGQALSGTTLTIMFFSAMTGLVAYWQVGDVLWQVGIALIVGYIAGAILGGKLQPLPGTGLGRLRPVWAALVVALGLFMIANGLRHFGPPLRMIYTPSFGLRGIPLYSLTVLIGLVVGFVSRVADLGGTLMAPALVYLLRFPAPDAQGTALFVLLIASLPGALRYGAVRQLDSRASVWVSFGAVVGALIGSRGAFALRADGLIFLYGVALALIGIGILIAPPAAPMASEE